MLAATGVRFRRIHSAACEPHSADRRPATTEYTAKMKCGPRYDTIYAVYSQSKEKVIPFFEATIRITLCI